jgi:23S rRNA (uracil1939-C5)-methyltransferase
LPERCRHFGTCGGCTLQDLSEAAYLERKQGAVARPLSRLGVEASIAELVRVPKTTRRRAVFAAKKAEGRVALGFRGLKSHAVVDMQECLVLTPALLVLTHGLRRMIGELLAEGEAAELHVVDIDAGFDLAIKWSRKSNPTLAAAIAPWASKLGIARITSNAEIVVQFGSPVVSLADTDVAVPPGAFLQPTKEGERILQRLVCEALTGASSVLDLFAGCGTFSLALARASRVHAVDRDRFMLRALSDAARQVRDLRPIAVECRDLSKQPLTRQELDRFRDAVLDPPRAGAEAQARELALSGLRRIAYVSCDAKTFARDAKILVDGGFRLTRVTPVDQFLWSDHIELVGQFERG